MSYKNSTELVILNRLSEIGDSSKAMIFETQDQIRDLMASGPSIGGSGLGQVGNFLLKITQMFSDASFLPILGSESINIPGTSYFSPVQPGTGTVPGGQSSFGVGPFSQFSGFPTGGSAAGLDTSSILSSAGIGNLKTQNAGIGANTASGSLGFGTIAGAAVNPSGGVGTATTAAGAGLGMASAAGFGSSYVIPAAGIVSGIGGLFTTLAPLFGGSGLAGIGTGTILTGFSGAVLSTYQNISSRILLNADTILTNKVKNLETVVKQVEAQEETLKKLLKDSVEGDKKALQDL